MQFYCDRQHLLHLPISNGVELATVCLSALLLWFWEPGCVVVTDVKLGDIVVGVLYGVV